MAYLTDDERSDQAKRVTELDVETLKGHIGLYLPEGYAKELALTRLDQCLGWCRRSADEIGSGRTEVGR